MTRRGMTLIECMVSLVVSSVLVGAVDASLVAGQRFARYTEASRGLRQNVRAAAGVLRAELEGASPPAGDLIAASDSAVVIRAQRGFGVVCAVMSPGSVILDDSLLSLLRAIDPAKDSARIYLDGDPLTTTDDHWTASAITQVRRGTCANGSAGTMLALSLTLSEFEKIGIGVAVRTFEIAEYRRYRDAQGLWWLGVRNPSGSGWSSSSPVAGPLKGRGGLQLRYLDATLAPTTFPDSVALIEADIAAADARPFSAPGHRFSPLADSVTIRIAPGRP